MNNTGNQEINPITRLDYPDPDVIRVDNTYYMVSTTMHFMPGCEILRSYDLVNWEHASYVYDVLDSTPGQKTEISVGEKITCVEYDYPKFHLSMDCFWAEIVSGDLVLKEHEAAKWLSREELDSVDWLPADLELIEKIKEKM